MSKKPFEENTQQCEVTVTTVIIIKSVWSVTVVSPGSFHTVKNTFSGIPADFIQSGQRTQSCLKDPAVLVLTPVMVEQGKLPFLHHTVPVFTVHFTQNSSGVTDCKWEIWWFVYNEYR